MTTLAEYEATFPGIDWREPITVHWHGLRRFACRICIADRGLKIDSPHQWEAPEEHLQHMVEHLPC